MDGTFGPTSDPDPDRTVNPPGEVERREMPTTRPAGQAGFRVVDLLKVFGSSADGVVAVDAEHRIVGWNQAATDLLGHRAEEVLGRQCSDVLQWCDRCGEEVCHEGCPSVDAARRGEILKTKEVIGRTSDGRKVWLSVSTIVPPPATAGGAVLLHVMREVSLPPELERLIAERLKGENGKESQACEGASLLSRLTPREREVLDLLSEGCDTAAIARRLVISPATARNHVQNVLGKLKVHSRLEAVALVLRHDA